MRWVLVHSHGKCLRGSLSFSRKLGSVAKTALGVVSASTTDCIEDRALYEGLDAWFTQVLEVITQETVPRWVDA
jgi:fermentation-respiration switch protein FrsA (DUF1100 family)